jgi:transcriptional regulator with XRE-family HTH domain
MIHIRKKARRNEAIAALRKVLDLSQAKFGTMIGTNRDTVVSWECGRNRLSDAFAWRIEMATGCERRCLLRGRAEIAGFFNQPYTRAYFDDFRKGLQKSDGATVQYYLDIGADNLALILQAASMPGQHNKNRLPAVWASFVQWVSETEKNFKLQPELDTVLSQRRLRMSDQANYGDFRLRSRSAAWQKCWKFKDDKRKPDSAPITLTTETHPAWNPGGDMRARTFGEPIP